ncbi:pentatricopeptide repeat-containing protein At4g02750-like isoform X1 [Selaginella moellendorffii]|uniref:pentatricopeptide repeat-containing protein At4g02750-like isoform X1 n=1 Tax=Selaginella moellendorffii TaxID=88036 RepID=UPI000D1C97F5|nr:pentatricopeptide repeat-containing protein At4g02750-like isoform X1 [Selaginella moellendorffii]XP_024545414.1 pentatricopeptide repeat-containing protein At4g02750-like isoform X1 [Selaginella moellendorffii]XP_024545415.1 pentatricopeptide repeat-containing protein At4g02750-like isoform X1 [Selaginella moellendorffii]|eukprot:XP_024545413.1 pentatricopeptide repeat-containing protein At4g02750-like isoform X1 [Selaginella moellendorffii]
MISAYAQSGHLLEAKLLFDRMPCWNLVTWTAMLAACVHAGSIFMAEDIFQKMPFKNPVACNAMLAGYAHAGKVEQAKCIFDKMPCWSLVSWSSLLYVYAGSRDMDLTRRFFDKMPYQQLVSWNTMLDAYAQNGYMAEARVMFNAMVEKDVISWTIMLAGYGLSGQSSLARKTFAQMPGKNEVSWDAMLTACTQAGDSVSVFQLFHTMHMTGIYNQVGFVSALNAHGQVGAFLPLLLWLLLLLSWSSFATAGLLSQLCRCYLPPLTWLLLLLSSSILATPAAVLLLGLLSHCSAAPGLLGCSTTPLLEHISIFCHSRASESLLSATPRCWYGSAIALLLRSRLLCFCRWHLEASSSSSSFTGPQDLCSDTMIQKATTAGNDCSYCIYEAIYTRAVATA